MTPRSTAAHLTREDTAIWSRVYLRAGSRPERGAGRASQYDRTDADLMLLARMHRAGLGMACDHTYAWTEPKSRRHFSIDCIRMGGDLIAQRTPTAPLTDEDWSIWWERPGYGSNPTLWVTWNGGDQRDANIMYEAQRERKFGAIGWMPALAPGSADPFPYTGGVLLGRRGEWLANIDFHSTDDMEQ